MKVFKSIFENLDMHFQELLRGASAAALMKLLAAFATFALHLVVGRFLGPSDSGIYFLAFTIVTIAAITARFGLDNTVVRFIAAANAVNQPGRVLGVYRISVTVTLLTSCLIGIGVYLAAASLAINLFKEPKLIAPLQTMALAIPPFALFVIHAQVLQGLKKTRDAIATLSVIAPSLTALFSLALIPLMHITGAAVAYCFSAVAALFFGGYRWAMWASKYREFKPEYCHQELMRSCMPLYLVAIMNLLINWLSTIMLGIYSTSYEVGLFSAANRTAMLVSFILISVNSIAAPKFAELYQRRDMAALSRLAIQSTKLMIGLATPVLLMFIVFADKIMGIFGSTFSAAGGLLVILSIGQFVNVATGSAGVILMMTGNEKGMCYVLVFSGLMCLILNVLLVSTMHSTGAAIATAVTVAMQNLLAFCLLKSVFRTK